MMKIGLTTIAAAAGCAALIPNPAHAAGTCSDLQDDYRELEKNFAEREGQAKFDNSAARATMRAAQDERDMKRAEMIVASFRENKCAVPKTPVSGKPYNKIAGACALIAFLKGPEKAACNRENWARED